jgi:hypothetical protein
MGYKLALRFWFLLLLCFSDIYFMGGAIYTKYFTPDTKLFFFLKYFNFYLLMQHGCLNSYPSRYHCKFITLIISDLITRNIIVQKNYLM